MTILIVYGSEPNFPATDQNPSAVRAQIGSYWVDYIGTLPTEDEVNAFLHPEVFPSTPALIAMGQMILTDGDVSSVTISAALAGAFMFDVGEFWVFFLVEQPDINYMALAYDGGSVRAFVQDDEKATDHFVIRTTDFAGTPTNPPALNFEIKRVI